MRNCIHFLYRLSGFIEKLNVQNCVNSMRNCVYYMYRWLGLAEKLNIRNSVNSIGNFVHKCTDGLDLQKY